MSELEMKPHKGLSPSSFALFMGCNRKYFHKKVAKTPIDSDSTEDLESFQVGKAFHKALEDTRHELDGFTPKVLAPIIEEFKLSQDIHLPLVFAMLGSYKKMHKKAGLVAVACEVPIETDDFFGITDVVLQNPESGHWYIGDMKTAGTFNNLNIPATLPRHPQLTLYAAHYQILAEMLNLDPKLFDGCRYRLTTKSKSVKKASETPKDFIQRLSGLVMSYDYFIPKDILQTQDLFDLHVYVSRFINKKRDTLEPRQWVQNYANCTSYFRPCEFWSQCHGKNHSDMRDLKVVTS